MTGERIAKLVESLGGPQRFLCVEAETFRDAVLLLTPLETSALRVTLLSREDEAQDAGCCAFYEAIITESGVEALERRTDIDFDDPGEYACFLAAALRETPVIRLAANGVDAELSPKVRIDDVSQVACITCVIGLFLS